MFGLIQNNGSLNNIVIVQKFYVISHPKIATILKKLIAQNRFFLILFLIFFFRIRDFMKDVMCEEGGEGVTSNSITIASLYI